MNEFKRSINALKAVLRDKNCKRMNLSTVKGFLGELIVAEKLSKEGCRIEYKGNQSGVDLIAGGVSIDVKCSTFKDELPNFPQYWEWALKQKSKKKEITCDYFVCVALNKNYEPVSFFVIKGSDVEKFPPGFRQFRNVVRSFAVTNHKIPAEYRSDVVSAFKRSKQLLSLGVVRSLLFRDNLKRYLS